MLFIMITTDGHICIKVNTQFDLFQLAYLRNIYFNTTTANATETLLIALQPGTSITLPSMPINRYFFKNPSPFITSLKLETRVLKTTYKFAIQTLPPPEFLQKVIFSLHRIQHTCLNTSESIPI